MRKERPVIDVYCDYDRKLIPENHKLITINNLDFCSTECLEKYIKENSLITCPVCNGDENIKCQYCGSVRKIDRSISDILEYGSDKTKCEKCNGTGVLDHSIQVRSPDFNSISSVSHTLNQHIPSKICDICKGQGTIKIPNKKV